MVELYKTIVSWITFRFEQWFWKDAKKKNIRYIYSDDNCKVDETGGPYEFDLSELEKDNKTN
tara:strand:+ start:364 stop:549 length:186 start_codon:yes stop_codon:yes gene_type:complete